MGEWPPLGAVAEDPGRLYTTLADAGLEWGTRTLTAAWRRGDEFYAEVGVDEDVASGFGLAPLLTDIALHAGDGALSEGDVRLPSSWRNVHLHASGAEKLRIRVAPAADASVSLYAEDALGRLVFTAESVRSDPVTPEQVAAGRPAHRDALWEVTWTPVEQRGETGPGLDVLDLGRPDTEPVVAARTSVEKVMAALRRALEDGTTLLVVTHGAVSTEPGEAADPAGAAVWGLLRTAQLEHPGRVVVVDVEPGAEWRPGPLPDGEPQLAVRQGRLLAPRLTSAPGTGAPSPWGEGTVLVAGVNGTRDEAVARHLVAAHGVRRLLLTTERGTRYEEEATELAVELTALGADVTVTVCDPADRQAVAALLAGIPAAHPLTGVILTAPAAGSDTSSADRANGLQPAWAARPEAAWNLHELTKDLDLSAFVLFSSPGGALGHLGAGGAAAADGFLDGLAAHRAALGLPALSVGYGNERSAGYGLRPLAPEETPALLDAALAAAGPALLAAPLNRAALRASHDVPPLLRDLVPGGSCRAADAHAPHGEALARRLAELGGPEQEALLTGIVSEHVAAVLGHADADGIRPDHAFKEIGFDSVTAVELRNRLGAVTGVRLPATVVFDHPTPAALARFLRDRVAPTADPAVALQKELDALEARLTGAAGLDPSGRRAVATRLRGILDRWSHSHASETHGTEETAGTADAEDALTSASATDLFDFIDNELGRAAG
ncbi:KR domain-containing protein [Streptomyces sp. CSDS2]|uniref:type I polyketide synthase n=1 Tax=Streptomyces sp. CSDS2 TaxID=3055051 RepID=UPI0025B21642|nr:type I polyketide synthase [Streptomyces sp. CSDS2]MDN3265888.1 KR domain-containing protein [Streptomyces sp. CSDS2]